MVAIALGEVTKTFASSRAKAANPFASSRAKGANTFASSRAKAANSLPGDVVAVDRLSLDVTPGEFMVLLGPTGCGKSTVLRLVAGLEEPTSGEIRFDGRLMNDVPAQDRGVGMVFQHYALHPHLTVAENIAQPLRAAHTRQDEITARVNEIAELLGLAEHLGRSPSVLSGGQRQRTAMARAILRRPRVFLLDEPLSNLDAGVRAELRGEISQLARGVATTIYVTHDQVEAMTMADRVALLRRGVLQQVGTPHDVYSDPATLFVAAFLGTPRINLLQAAVYAAAGGAAIVDLGAQQLEVPPADPLAHALRPHHNERVTVGLRPDALHLGEGGLVGRVRLVEQLGHEVIVHLDTDSVPAPPETIGLDLPETHVVDAMGDELPGSGALHQLGSAVRHATERLKPKPRQAGPPPLPTARTEYGFYPTYEAPAGSGGPVGDMVLRLPTLPTVPRPGESLALAVDLAQLLLFDRAGRRIPLPREPNATAGVSSAS